MSDILSIGNAVPSYRYQQKQARDFLEQFYTLNDQEQRLFRHLFAKSGICEKYSILPDFQGLNKGLLFCPEDEQPAIEQRMEAFHQSAPSLAKAAVHDCLRGPYADMQQQITHVITTTCTGLQAPGLEIMLTDELNMPLSVKRYPLNFLGCHAAFKALDLADKICKTEPQARVLIVSVELCSLHFQNIKSKDNWLATALFGDGAAAALVGYASEARHPRFRINKFFSVLQPSQADKMTWKISAKGFLMHLSSHIPELLMNQAENLIDETMENMDFKDIDYWCFHPGGPGILDKMQTKLDIPDEKISASYQVLRNYGNMSSPTIFFVLNQLLITLYKQHQQAKIFAAGFGPGLSLEGMQLEYIAYADEHI